MRSTQDRRIATESAEEREARLQQLRVAQQQRIATETTSEEIEARRARDRRNHMDLKTAEVPLFQQTCSFQDEAISLYTQKCLCS